MLVTPSQPDRHAGMSAFLRPLHSPIPSLSPSTPAGAAPSRSPTQPPLHPPPIARAHGHLANLPPSLSLYPQAYNSIFNSDPSVAQGRLVGNFPLLPLRTKTRGPAYTLPLDAALPAGESPDPDSESYDILDEVLALFRANTFFRNFEIQGPADRLLVYGIWFVSDCLSKIKPSAGVRDATKDVMNLALDNNFAIPGDPSFPLNQMYEAPRDRQDAELLRQYMAQVRHELAIRLLARVYEEGGDGKPSKWWLSFTKRKFMGKGL
ncbi:uncharacterized protein E0L32_007641 [Thyridium curvatum]|uniref:Actin-related protein 2/3 complex subunit 3 n=1 Tax=Thyridium curvatum TaxID=1093900 RepID=A0A507AP29_9PEZI|nr:uncharacterized protein E0L32_007641 [Thyridium curvatum]TPX11662.1 hypothetical protein E0L32_007641 [Thyridium curvatum]